jgi:hypothetical protein
MESINGIIEILIHFNSFRNIELFNQGLYQLRTKVYFSDKNFKYLALPYMIVKSKSIEEKNKKSSFTDSRNIIQSHISKDTFEFVSQTFLIRYSDEEVRSHFIKIVMDDFCHYRFDIPLEKLQSNPKFVLEIELFFTETLIGQSKLQEKDSNMSISKVEFKSVARQVIQVQYESGIYNESYVPIAFKDLYLCHINMSVSMVHLENYFKSENSVNNPNSLSPIKIDFKGNDSITLDIDSQLKTDIQSLELDPKNLHTINMNYISVVVSLVKMYFSLDCQYKEKLNRLLENLDSEDQNKHLLVKVIRN